MALLRLGWYSGGLCASSGLCVLVVYLGCFWSLHACGVPWVLLELRVVFNCSLGASGVP